MMLKKTFKERRHRANQRAPFFHPFGWHNDWYFHQFSPFPQCFISNSSIFQYKMILCRDPQAFFYELISPHNGLVLQCLLLSHKHEALLYPILMTLEISLFCIYYNTSCFPSPYTFQVSVLIDFWKLLSLSCIRFHHVFESNQLQ